jgi:flagellar motility protein MotE (MotC chaperone)
MLENSKNMSRESKALIRLKEIMCLPSPDTPFDSRGFQEDQVKQWKRDITNYENDMAVIQAKINDFQAQLALLGSKKNEVEKKIEESYKNTQHKWTPTVLLKGV